MTQPSFSKMFLWGSRTCVTRASIGKPPRSRLHATRVFLKLRLRGLRKIEPGSLMDVGARRSGPACTESRNAASDTVRAIGPSSLWLLQGYGCGYAGTRPVDGRKPITLQ